MKNSDTNIQLKNELKKNEEFLVIASVEDLIYAWAKKNNLLETMRSDYSHYKPINVGRDFSPGKRLVQSPLIIGNLRTGNSVPKNTRSTQPSTLDFVKSYIAGNASAVRDIQKQLYPMLRDLGLRGRVVLKTVKGVEYAIIKGFAGLRSILTGTRYLTTHPKIVQLGIGKVGLKSSIRAGGMLTCILTVAVDILQALLGEMELRKLGVVIVSDLAKVGITVVLSECAALIAAGTAIGTIACGPLIVAIGASIFIGMGLEKLDRAYGLTDKLAMAIEKTAEKMAEKIVEGAEIANEVKENVIGNIVKGARAFIYHFSGHDVFRY